MKFKIHLLKSTKGLSMPMAIGFVVLLMISSAAANELIVRTLRSVQRIEASNRAYLAAEAGIEDALYELTPHFAGYETPPLPDIAEKPKNVNDKAHGADLSPTSNILWQNRWQIESHNQNADPTIWGGKFYPDQKLIVYLYNDFNDLAADNTSMDAINQTAPNIQTLKEVEGNFTITFTIPDAINFITSGVLEIDNDDDDFVNEDPEGDYFGCIKNTDCDEDGSVNEDGENDAVILWKLTDGVGRSLIPIKGCLSDSDPDGFPQSGDEKSEICEKEFHGGNGYAVTLDSYTNGINQNGEIKMISQFINLTSPTSKLHFEFLVIAPLEYFISGGGNIVIPYLEYEVTSASDKIPFPYFIIKSDGYFGNFKQSITTKMTPKTTVPLFDFTIIQQQ